MQDALRNSEFQKATAHVYEVRPRKDKRGVDLISDALPFGRLWYGEPNAVASSNPAVAFRSQADRRKGREKFSRCCRRVALFLARISPNFAEAPIALLLSARVEVFLAKRSRSPRAGDVSPAARSMSIRGAH